MKLDELRSYLEIYKLAEMSRALRRNGDKAFTALRKLEYAYTCYELQNFFSLCPNEELGQDEIQHLLDLLAKRWQRVQNTNSAYNQDTTNPANGLYYQIACDLQNELGISCFKLLMPSLKKEESAITLKNLIDPDVQFSHFVLTDDNEGFIEVEPCLEYFARTGLFLHTDIVNDEQRELTEDEIKRIVNHSKPAQNYYEAIDAIHKIKNKSGTIGFALSQLMLQLQTGSSLDQGTEYVATEHAHVAILNLVSY